jgi:lipopolysaccharide/colanic/teichoic acid biosynthesis glycosyltransferase
VKRTFDVTLSGVGLLTSSPLWLVLAAAVKLEGGGDVFYGQARVGLGGRPFFVWKFRSMVQNAEAGCRRAAGERARSADHAGRPVDAGDGAR